MQTGRVIGETDRLGGEAAERPVSFQEVFATLYHNLGVRLDAELTPLLETIVNALREHAPKTRIAFNSNPFDTVEAIQRQI